MTLEELIKKESSNKYVQTDDKNLHWFIDKDLTDWAHEDRPQWGGSVLKGDKNLIIYKIFDGQKDNSFDTYLVINNTKQELLYENNGYESVAAWLDMYKFSKEK